MAAVGGELSPHDRAAVGKLQALVRIPTVSDTDESRIDDEAFEALHTELEIEFPLLHNYLERVRVCKHSLLFRWPGESDERPVVLMAHQDVVPIDPSMPWTHPPFAGIIEDGVLWGRGTLDDKGALVAICEAVERLLEADFIPAQDVWLSFGAREETSGPDAAEAVKALRARGVEPWLVVDEGGAIAMDAFPGVKAPLGVIGIAEKGTTTLQLRAEGRGGHASTPAPNGPTVRIAKAIVSLERNQFPARLSAPVIAMFERLAPHAPAPMRLLLERAERLAPALARALVAAGPETAATVRTTMAVTKLEGSPAHNVIASSASAAVNLRIQPGDTVASAIAHVRKAIGDNEMAVDVVDANEASPISPVDDDAFRLLESTISETFPEAVVTPYLMMAATDARFFTRVCERVYRFSPFVMTKSQRESIHSYDERIGVEDFVRGIEWYRLLLERLS